MRADCGDVPSGVLTDTLAQLVEISVSAEADDLSILAKMHGMCECIAQAVAPEGPLPDPELARTISHAAVLLEQLVLGETDDPAGTLEEFRSKLRGVSADRAPDHPRSEQAPSSAEANPFEQLANGFDEPDISPASTQQTGKAVEPAEATPNEPAGEPVEEYVQEPLTLNEKETEFVKGFVEEAREHIESIETAVLDVERTPDDLERINDLFRPFHTIKGMAGFLNLRDINCLTHEAETLLDQARKGQRGISAGLIDLIFDVVDILKAQITAVAAHLEDPGNGIVPQPPVADMIRHLRTVVAGRVEADRRSASGDDAGKLGSKLVEGGAIARENVDFAVTQQQSSESNKKTGEILIDSGAVTPRQVSQALRDQGSPQAGGRSPASTEQSIRIDTQKLDALVDLVGELVIAQTLVATNRQVVMEPKLSRDVGQVGKIVRDVQEAAMAMRMVPIGATFQKMARLVRDVSRKAGKEVELHISGEDTELDKNVIQQIGDPLVHMVRNAVDHGIETSTQRLAADKEPVGHVYLSAYHHAGNIVIEIRDDGRGIDREKLTAKAIERGVIQPDDDLNEQQTYQLVFAPGFSTAEVVTDISGRGVGMDVVKRNIEQLRGRVEIASEPGKGSTFSIRLPLTLAIIDGMIVRVGSERYVVPTISIEQSLRPQPSQITSVQHRGEMVQVRGSLVPLIQLGQLFGVTRKVDPCEAMVIIAQCDDRQIGIVVEELIGQQQVVIKTLGERFELLRGVSGAAILGDGRVGLILEMLGLEALHNDLQVDHPANLHTAAPADSKPCQEMNAPQLAHC